MLSVGVSASLCLLLYGATVLRNLSTVPRFPVHRRYLVGAAGCRGTWSRAFPAVSLAHDSAPPAITTLPQNPTVSGTFSDFPIRLCSDLVISCISPAFWALAVPLHPCMGNVSVPIPTHLPSSPATPSPSTDLQCRLSRPLASALSLHRSFQNPSRSQPNSHRIASDELFIGSCHFASVGFSEKSSPSVLSAVAEGAGHTWSPRNSTLSIDYRHYFIALLFC